LCSLWYFREDVGINSHHWHWHLVYPNIMPDEDKDRKDYARRGELFYYMHQQVIARYNVERFCNRLARVTPFKNFRSNIGDGYYPKLTLENSSANWPGRMANSSLNDLNRKERNLSILEMERWVDRVSDAISTGFVHLPNGEKKLLNEDPSKDTGINVLANMIVSCAEYSKLK
jgi:tyrosinase